VVEVNVLNEARWFCLAFENVANDIREGEPVFVFYEGKKKFIIYQYVLFSFYVFEVDEETGMIDEYAEPNGLAFVMEHREAINEELKRAWG
jgi:hypothetical protein